jgi:RimJ/RimL family protein N-acetyltransferase
MSFWINDLQLKGQLVELIPLVKQHTNAISLAVQDGELWKLWYTGVPSPETVNTYVQNALESKKTQGWLAFVVKDLKTQKIIGSTRYCNVDNNHKRLEIGYTWYSKSTQRTGVNTETKYLLLKHAFEQLNAIAVEFRTHWFNHQSRSAITRLGAKQDGVLRNHQKMADGSFRDTVVYSIIESEWLSVKKHLQYKMEKY